MNKLKIIFPHKNNAPDALSSILSGSLFRYHTFLRLLVQYPADDSKSQSPIA